VQPDQVRRYADLAQPALKGKVCTRSGTHPYMLSLIGALAENLGEASAEQWARGVVANFARSPRGGDTDQIRAVASGECGVALTNSYYLARLMRSGRPEDQAMVARLGVVFPNQADHGTHVNIAGGAVARHARNVPAAVRFLEYLASPPAQVHFADGNNEWPVVRGVAFDNPALRAMTGGSFKAEELSVNRVGMNQVKVQQMLDRVGFK
jgi:iron(III) transport system substrate-binding protein